MASLLDSRKNKEVHYDIYCVCTKVASGVAVRLQEIIAARDKNLYSTMKVIDNPYEDSYEVRKYPQGLFKACFASNIAGS